MERMSSQSRKKKKVDGEVQKRNHLRRDKIETAEICDDTGVQARIGVEIEVEVTNGIHGENATEMMITIEDEDTRIESVVRKMIGVGRNAAIHIVEGVQVVAKNVGTVEGTKHLRAVVVVGSVQGERVRNVAILMQLRKRNQDGANIVVMTRQRKEKSTVRSPNLTVKQLDLPSKLFLTLLRICDMLHNCLESSAGRFLKLILPRYCLLHSAVHNCKNSSQAHIGPHFV